MITYTFTEKELKDKLNVIVPLLGINLIMARLAAINSDNQEGEAKKFLEDGVQMSFRILTSEDMKS